MGSQSDLCGDNSTCALSTAASKHDRLCSVQGTLYAEPSQDSAAQGCIHRLTTSATTFACGFALSDLQLEDRHGDTQQGVGRDAAPRTPCRCGATARRPSSLPRECCLQRGATHRAARPRHCQTCVPSSCHL